MGAHSSVRVKCKRRAQDNSQYFRFVDVRRVLSPKSQPRHANGVVDQIAYDIRITMSCHGRNLGKSIQRGVRSKLPKKSPSKFHTGSSSILRTGVLEHMVQPALERVLKSCGAVPGTVCERGGSNFSSHCSMSQNMQVGTQTRSCSRRIVCRPHNPGNVLGPSCSSCMIDSR